MGHVISELSLSYTPLLGEHRVSRQQHLINRTDVSFVLINEFAIQIEHIPFSTC